MSFPHLPVVEGMIGLFEPLERDMLQETCFVCLQHLIESNGSMIEALLRAGAKPDQFFIGGKFYSTHDATWKSLRDLGATTVSHVKQPRSWRYTQRVREEVGRLWQFAIVAVLEKRLKRVIVLDDGGFCLRSIPSELLRLVPIFGIEQTTSGVNLRKLPAMVPIIQVATAAAKKELESPLIAEAVAAKMKVLRCDPNNDMVVGIAGIGSIGTAVADYWISQGNRVIAFDRNKARLRWCSKAWPSCETTSDLRELVATSDMIFGCTGADFLRAFNWKKHSRAKRLRNLRLVSCSSRDIEFLSVLGHYYSEKKDKITDLLGTLELNLGKVHISVERGGYPINFDCTPESVPSEDIQLTRGLMLAGVLQALRLDLQKVHGANNRLALDSSLQKFVVSKWLECNPSIRVKYEEKLLTNFADLAWIARNSSASKSAK
jgi:hypothetical protein